MRTSQRIGDAPVRVRFTPYPRRRRNDIKPVQNHPGRPALNEPAALG